VIIYIEDLFVIAAMSWFCGFAFAKRDYWFSVFFGSLVVAGVFGVLMSGGPA